MLYTCSKCHHRFETEADAEPERCPNCKVEAGLERAHGIPTAMRLFGLVVGGVVVAAVGGDLISRLSG